jgi:hypothetical protein
MKPPLLRGVGQGELLKVNVRCVRTSGDQGIASATFRPLRCDVTSPLNVDAESWMVWVPKLKAAILKVLGMASYGSKSIDDGNAAILTTDKTPKSFREAFPLQAL